MYVCILFLLIIYVMLYCYTIILLIMLYIYIYTCDYKRFPAPCSTLKYSKDLAHGSGFTTSILEAK